MCPYVAIVAVFEAEKNCRIPEGSLNLDVIVLTSDHRYTFLLGNPSEIAIKVYYMYNIAKVYGDKNDDKAF